MDREETDIMASIVPLKIIRDEVVPVNAAVAAEDAPAEVEDRNNRLYQGKKTVLKRRLFSLSFLFPKDTQIEFLKNSFLTLKI